MPNNQLKDESLKQRSNSFVLVIYPNEDLNHRKFLNYVTTRSEYRCVWIEHDKDFNEDLTPKKAHTHILVKTRTQYSISAFLKYFDGWNINYAEPAVSVESCLRYFMHDTPSALEEGKFPYPVESLHGDSKFIKLLIQNSNFVQLREYANMAKECVTVADMIIRISNDENTNDIEKDEKIKFLMDNSHLICCMSNQEINEFWRKRANNLTN